LVTNGVEVVVCLQFPEGQQLTGLGQGPGILVDDVAPDNSCDFFTVDGGANPSTSWFRPAENDPLDWGFVVTFEPQTAVQATHWSTLKAMYGGHRPLPYRTP
jgi:hypothetical protein